MASAVRAQSTNPTIARVWNERALQGIRRDTPHPPAQARNLFSLSVAMYDAWAAYDTHGAVGYVYRAKHVARDVAAARREAISQAAYRLLVERHRYSRTDAESIDQDDAQMRALGYTTGNTSIDPDTPGGVGNRVYAAVSEWFAQDGSRQLDGSSVNPYPDYPPASGGFVAVNPPLAVALGGINDGNGNTVLDVNQWQPLKINNGFDQNGFPTSLIQPYLGAQWLGVRPFALSRETAGRPWIDPGPPPRFTPGDSDAFREQVVEVIRRGSELTPDDGVEVDISPGRQGDNPLGTNDGHGHPLNPVTGQPYPPNVVRRGDFARVLAEFWADGPNSETPPGHWNVLANAVTDHPLSRRRIGGEGPELDALEWDVKLYLALNASLHDAACAAWSLKRHYLGGRPITAVRYLAGLGQSSDPKQPGYHPDGLPLIPGLIERVTLATVASGRHRGLTPGRLALWSWGGEPSDPVNESRGVGWHHGISWVPYQRRSFVTPAFPGYISGHSTFSRAAAEILAAFTGSPFFPGGIGTHSVPADTGLSFEKGPSRPVQLQWATYFDAADQAGLSRIWGGIHPPVDDLAGRRVGSEVGQRTWALVQRYWDGSIARAVGVLSLESRPAGDPELRLDMPRGLYCQLESAPTLSGPFRDLGDGLVRVQDTRLVRPVPTTGNARFFRARIRLTPDP